MTESDVIAAGYSPGFSVDPTYWRVFIDGSRYLRQEVVISNFTDPEKYEVLRYTARLSHAEFAAIWEIIDRIAFKEFKKSYKPVTFCSTDCETHWAKVRFASGRAKETSVYNLHGMIAEVESNPFAIGFTELWNGIHRHAPHGKVSVHEGRPKPWWKWW